MSHLPVFSHHSPLKMMHDLFPAQVYQLPPYRDKHFSPKSGPRPPGRAADTKPSLGGICSEGTGPAWRSQPTAGQEVWPSPPPYTPHQIHQYIAGMSPKPDAQCCCHPYFPAINWILRLTITLFIFKSRTLYAQLVTLIIPGIFLNVGF